VIERALQSIASFPAAVVDGIVRTFAPGRALERAQARLALKRYAGAETNRLNSHKKPQNRSADQENAGPWGADALRAWVRMLVRDNPYARGVVETIVSSVIGTGIVAHSMLENADGEDEEEKNERREKVWEDWCKVCDIRGKLHFHEMQRLGRREQVEAGECLIHRIKLKGRIHKGKYRPVPLALEMIEADRIAYDKDTYISRPGSSDVRIVRGIEMDEDGTVLAYWVYKDHPTAPHTFDREPVRLPAEDVIHLFRQERIGQSRGVTWYAPIVEMLRTLGIYIENEMQASAVASCFTAFWKTKGARGTGLKPLSTGADTSDSAGNEYAFMEPAMIMKIGHEDGVEIANPNRPNSNAAPWINLMLRGIAVGTGLSFELVARDFSQTSYSSNRASQLEDRRRFREWQDYDVCHMCQPVWEWFVEAAAMIGHPDFPSVVELDSDFDKYAPVEWQTPMWEWVDPQADQASSQGAIDGFQSTYQAEIGNRRGNWRRLFKQRAKEEQLLRKLKLISPNALNAATMTAEVQGAQAATTTAEAAQTTAEANASQQGEAITNGAI